MAVKSSGSLSLTTDIVGEFGGSAPHSLSEYYGGGDYVPAGANPGVATSGQTNMGSYYNSVAATVLTISSNTNNYDIGSAVISAGGDKNTPVILTINSGVTVGSTSSTNPAMKTGTGWGAGVTINITNNGSIVGASGSNTSATTGSPGYGGAGSWGCSYSGNAGGAGTGSAEAVNNGGHAFEHSQTGDNNLSVIFDTAGTRTGGSAGTRTMKGGGGGGAGGGGGWVGDSYYKGGNGGRGQNGSSGPYNGASGGTNAQRGGWGGYAGNSGGGPQGYSNQCSHYSAPGGAGGSTGYANGTAGSALSGNTGQIS